MPHRKEKTTKSERSEKRKELGNHSRKHWKSDFWKCRICITRLSRERKHDEPETTVGLPPFGAVAAEALTSCELPVREAVKAVLGEIAVAMNIRARRNTALLSPDSCACCASVQARWGSQSTPEPRGKRAREASERSERANENSMKQWSTETSEESTQESEQKRRASEASELMKIRCNTPLMTRATKRGKGASEANSSSCALGYILVCS